jgi:hypothetical protein
MDLYGLNSILIRFAMCLYVLYVFWNNFVCFICVSMF